MKKLASFTIALIISTVSSFAVATNWEDDWPSNVLFVGLEGGYSKTKVDVESVGGKSDDTGFYGVRIGTSWDYETRAYLTVGVLKPKDVTFDSASDNVKEIEQLNLLLSADYLLLPDLDIKPFVGITMGTAKTKAEDFRTHWGLAYGAQAGLIYQIGNVDLEAGVKYLTTNSSDKGESNTDPAMKLQVNESHQAYIAASIHF